MSKKADATYAGIGSDAVKAKTGKGWAEWFTVLDAAGAAAWPHKQIATYLHEHDCGDWWSQMVTVGYEQARGLRVKHQTADGFSASGSKTVTVPLATLFDAWSDTRKRAKWLPDVIEVRSATENKSMRITGTDGESSVVIQFYAKGTDKSQVTIEQRKLADAKAVEQVKAYWSEALGKLKAMLEAPPAKMARPRK
jgi:uncharacterized protein YndB with AHSA1/START domain